LGIKYKIDAQAGVIFSCAEGEIGAANIQANWKRISTDPLYHPDFGHLFDGRSAKITFSGAEARNLANWFKGIRLKSKSSILINDKSTGFARMFLGWREEFTKIFYDLSSARDWLGLPPEG